MKFKKGQSGNPKGKPKGAQNKTTKAIKEAVQAAFDELQEDPKVNLVAWGKENPSAFYQLASKLIPAEIKADVDGSVPLLPPQIVVLPFNAQNDL